MFQEPDFVLTSQIMAKEERLRSKVLYKSVLAFLKIIPMLICFLDIVNTVLCILGIECRWLSYIGGISFLTLAFLYLASYVFRFCSYHRMFLHYVLVTNILSVIDFEFGIPISNRGMLDIHIVIFGIFLFLVLYFYRREKCCRQSRNSCLASSMT